MNDNGQGQHQRRLEARIGYGFAALGGRFTATLEIAVCLSDARRDYSLGWRLVRHARPGHTGSLKLSFVARRSESANPASGSGAGFRITNRY